MKRIEISLREPFENSLEQGLALPETQEGPRTTDEQITAALRRIYELAFGRSVETPLGLIAIGPALNPALAETRLHVANRRELLAAIREKLASASDRDDRAGNPHSIASSILMELQWDRLKAPHSNERSWRSSASKQAGTHHLAFEGAGS